MPDDLLVKLYDLPPNISVTSSVKANNIDVRRALAIDKHLIVTYVRDCFSEQWASECDVSFSQHPPSCFIAVHDNTIVGFACFAGGSSAP